MAIIEGFVVDTETGRPVFYAVVKIFDDAGNIVAECSTSMKGEFSADVPEGIRYKVCAFSQIYDPVCFEVLDDRGDWVPLGEEGRRVRLDTKRATLGELGEVR